MSLHAVDGGIGGGQLQGLARSVVSEKALREQAVGVMDRFNREALRLACDFGAVDHRVVQGFFPFSPRVLNRLKELFADEDKHRERIDIITRLGVSLFAIRNPSADIHLLSKMSDSEFNSRYDQTLGRNDVIGRADQQTENQAAYFARNVYQLNVEYLRATTDAARQWRCFGQVISGLDSGDIDQISVLTPDVFHRLAQMLLTGYCLRLPEKVFESALNCRQRQLPDVGLRLVAAIDSNRRH